MSEWVIICNPKYYDVVGAFKKLHKLNWKQSVNIEEGDIIYIYIGRPYSSIKYKCLATAVDLPEVRIDDSEFEYDTTNYGNYGRYMELKMLDSFELNELEYENLRENGLKSVQGPSRVTDELSKYLNKVISQYKKNNTSYDYEAEKLINADEKYFLEEKIKTFSTQIEESRQREKELEGLRKVFVEDYNIKNIIKMKKEDYVVGLGRKDTFCYRIENELQELGNIHGSSSSKFGIYYGKRGSDTEEKYRTAKTKFGEDPDEAFEKIKEEISLLIVAGKEENINYIRKSKIAPMFRGKILSTYFPNKYLPIFSEPHLDYFIAKLGLSIEEGEDDIDKQLKLLDLMDNHPVMKKWSIHNFANFLYTMYGKPSDKDDQAKKIQEKRDKNYPREYIVKLNINKGEWEKTLKNNNVLYSEDIELIKRIYLSNNHAETCHSLALKDGKPERVYIKQVGELGKRISNKLNLEPIYDSNGKETWWSILFWGRYDEKNYFEWKLKPKLAQAILSLYPELDLITVNKEEDDKLIEDLRETAIPEKDFEYSGKPKEKQIPVYTNGSKTYPRDRKVAINALTHANYSCEIDDKHPTFIRKASSQKYTEPHHLVPMSYSDEFDVSLDVEENIVSLCSNCHNQLHYGKGTTELLRRLYDDRKDDLKKVGIDISLEKLISMY